MKPSPYSIIITYKIKDLIGLIILNKKLTFYKSITYLYESKTYEYLCNESTKLWHLSTNKLFDILEYEKKTNILKLPDFV